MRGATIAAIAALAWASPAAAQDSLAPPGADHRWLPCEEWVMFHWLPYNEERLFALLGTDRRGVERWLADDRRTLAELARRRGLDPPRVADALVAGAPAGRRAVLRDRALRTLTQSHLAQHVLFHVAHYPAVALRSRAIFGISPLRYQRVRSAGHTPAEIGRAAGRMRSAVAAAALEVHARGAARGVAGGETPFVQARRFRALQRRHIDDWLDQQIAPRRRVARGPFPRLRSRRELMCQLFGGRAGVRQVREKEST